MFVEQLLYVSSWCVPEKELSEGGSLFKLALSLGLVESGGQNGGLHDIQPEKTEEGEMTF